MAGIELMLGMALGYLAFTEEGRKMGNRMADFAMKSGKAAFENYVKKGTSGEPAEQPRKEEKHEDH